MMMRFLDKLALTLGALALLASPAWAQGQGRGGFGGGAAAFLMAPNVQKDLKLTDAQVRKVQESLREIRERHQGDYTALRDASPDVRSAKMATLNETVSDEVKKALSFSDEQSKRYDQISLQAHGVHGLRQSHRRREAEADRRPEHRRSVRSSKRRGVRSRVRSTRTPASRSARTLGTRGPRRKRRT